MRQAGEARSMPTNPKHVTAGRGAPRHESGSANPRLMFHESPSGTERSPDPGSVGAYAVHITGRPQAGTGGPAVLALCCSHSVPSTYTARSRCFAGLCSLQMQC